MFPRAIVRSTNIGLCKRSVDTSQTLVTIPYIPGRTIRKHSFYNSYQYRSHQTQVHSSINYTAAAVLFATSLLAGSLYFYQEFGHKSKATSGTIQKNDRGAEARAIMTGTPLPGRPGNLTPEQEAKLQEMWTATLHVFGVPILTHKNNGDSASTTGSESLQQP